MEYRNPICIVVVVYRQQYQNTKSFHSILSQQSFLESRNSHIIIYDNSEQPQVDINSFGFSIFHYYHDNSNRGVVPAYRYAMDYCLRNNISWILRLDQDSEFDQTLFNHFYNTINHNNKYAIVIPKIISKGRIISPTYRHAGGYYTIIDNKMVGIQHRPITYINSMSFINVSYDFVREAIIGAEYLLDLSDHEFAYKMPIEYVYVLDTFVEHELSVRDIKSVDRARYRLILKNEMSFVKHYETFAGFIIYYLRLLVRGLRLLFLQRSDLSAEVFKRMMD